MIPVDQEDLTTSHGDCLSAAVATILDLPLADVPKWIADDHDNDGEHNPEWSWWLRFKQWNKDQGVTFTEAEDPTVAGEPVLVFGPTTRGTYHAVVYRDGELAHDPHPSREGVLRVDRQYLLRRSAA